MRANHMCAVPWAQSTRHTYLLAFKQWPLFSAILKLLYRKNAAFVVATSVQPLIGGSRGAREASPLASKFSFRDVMESAKIQTNAHGDSRGVDEGNDKISRSLCLHLMCRAWRGVQTQLVCFVHLTSWGQSFFDDVLLGQHPPSLGFLTCQSRSRKVFQLGKISPAAAPYAGWSSALA